MRASKHFSSLAWRCFSCFLLTWLLAQGKLRLKLKGTKWDQLYSQLSHFYNPLHSSVRANVNSNDPVSWGWNITGYMLLPHQRCNSLCESGRNLVWVALPPLVFYDSHHNALPGDSVAFSIWRSGIDSLQMVKQSVEGLVCRKMYKWTNNSFIRTRRYSTRRKKKRDCITRPRGRSIRTIWVTRWSWSTSLVKQTSPAGSTFVIATSHPLREFLCLD